MDWTPFEQAQISDAQRYLNGTEYKGAIKAMLSRGATPEQIAERHLETFPGREAESKIMLLAARGWQGEQQA